VKRTHDALRRTVAVGVVLPVHDEEELLDSALSALAGAFAQLDGWRVPMKLVVVLDACSDTSDVVAEKWQRRLERRSSSLEVAIMTCEAGNVGFARRLGCAALLDEWSRFSPSGIWLATTDADSRVPHDWLTAQVLQHESGTDFWSGRVKVDEWSSFHVETATKWKHAYEAEKNPVHGTSLGFNADAYLDVGEFQPLKTGEDQALYRAFVDHGHPCHHDSSVRVATSARREARAPYGFAHALLTIEAAVGA
jgi:hypothetical protein